jgi:hypothetical protein
MLQKFSLKKLSLMTMYYYLILFPWTSILNMRFTLVLYYVSVMCHFQTYMLRRLVFVEKKHSHQQIKASTATKFDTNRTFFFFQIYSTIILYVIVPFHQAHLLHNGNFSVLQFSVHLMFTSGPHSDFTLQSTQVFNHPHYKTHTLL